MLFPDLIRDTSAASIVSVLVGLEDQGKETQIASCLMACEVDPNPGLKGALEPLHHCCILVAVADEIMDVMAFNEPVQLYVEKPLTGFCLEPYGFARTSLFEESLQCR